MSPNKKIVVILGDGKLLGQQRANIQVFYSLKDENILPVFILGLRQETNETVNYLKMLKFKFERILFSDLFNRGMGFIAALRNSLSLVKSNILLARQLLKIKPEYIHITNEINFRNFFPVLFFSFIPIIYRVGDIPRQHHWVFRYAWKILIIPRTKKFISVSEYVKSILITAGANEKKIKVIYSYPPVRKSSELKTKLHSIKKGHFTIYYIGQLTKNKGVHLLLEVADILLKRYSDIVFIFTGDGDRDSKFYNDLMQQKEPITEKERLIFTGYLDDVDPLFSISSIHVCPSIYDEPLANVVLEAKKNSVPSVIFSSGGLPELVEHLQDGYICKEKTTEELVNGIEYFYARKSDLKYYKEKANKSLERLGITEEIFVKKWLKVFGTD
jgi:glycosyltransferase involved in cell wall biosynthesis